MPAKDPEEEIRNVLMPISSPRVHQSSAGISGIDGSIGLDELARLAPVAGVRIGTVERADDAARHREAVSVGIAEREHRLPG